MANMKEAQLGIEQGKKEQLVQKLNSVYCEREALENLIRACQWNTQGSRSAEFTQILSAVSPDTQNTRQQGQQTVQPFTPSNEVAERISMMGARIPSTYHDLSEYSKIESPPQSTDVQKNADYLAKVCEQFSQTTRQAIQAAQQAHDEVTVQALAEQLHPAEQLATQLRRFQN
ncbi:hypothetical protein NX722_09205 [Endozoicomonas gorgoniicola]|uniref:Uncharacterized protein n=1 Tax=Endozoicomonas gorgoniicola TaxID=1234144 RepID=A0ABT3MTW4_9GAMM|nr:ferritin-like domain-containing protein [Endozoicomonas gorgoniicola]MCW7552815.1 hypothetical protein [Endozoicomonas gorgoniicola]